MRCLPVLVKRPTYSDIKACFSGTELPDNLNALDEIDFTRSLQAVERRRRRRGVHRCVGQKGITEREGVITRVDVGTGTTRGTVVRSQRRCDSTHSRLGGGLSGCFDLEWSFLLVTLSAERKVDTHIVRT